MRDEIIDTFPGLADDPNFSIQSKQDPDYNCIAWAAIYDDRWIWPVLSNNTLDGRLYWPEDIRNDDSPEAFIELFNSFGYELCSSSDLEHGYRKIALYVNPDTGKITHAARQRKNGLWTSKLGKEHDITHSTPESLESTVYGKVIQIMKMKL